MNILHIAYYTILRNIRDWKYLMVLLAAPLLTILLTGVSTDHIDKLKITERVKVEYFSEDAGDIAKGFNSFMEAKQVKEAFAVQKGVSLEDGMKRVKAGKIEAFIYLPKDSLEGKKTNIVVYTNRPISPAKPLVESYINNFNTGIAVKGMSRSYVTQKSLSNVNEIPISPIGVVPNGVDRWTYSNMLIFLFYGAILSGFSIITEIKKHTILRIDSMPINNIANISGKIIGNTVTLFGCVVVMIIFTKYIFNSNWNGNMVIILLTFFLYCIVVICFGFIVGLVTKKIGITVLIVICLNVLLFAGSGGGWGQNQGVFPKLSLISPHFYVTQSLTNNIFGGLTERVSISIFALAIMAAVLLLASILLGRRRVR